ncbi:hypothetical protein BL253_28215 [Pseudofrankia asymbiotica]|uniref:DNA-binding protein n=1 Tax=Pseudofrankia asymbiotica TaxID=1834516 RepID=A0A1V2I3R0_9ACTN|nr:hypothetical protein BL253_28215 [Pseudofrankia asymbiotica]
MTTVTNEATTEETPRTPTLVVEAFDRVAPPLTERTAAFWTSGADGVLRIARCHGCGRYQHPPRPTCPACRGRDVGFAPVSGRGTVWSWTLNRYGWVPSMPPPYVVADVELVEQPGLRLLTNILDCPPDAMRVGLPVRVCFSKAGDAYVPLFRPEAGILRSRPETGQRHGRPETGQRHGRPETEAGVGSGADDGAG